MANTTVVRMVALCALVGPAACAHVEFKAPDDPVEEARLRISDISSSDGNVACAAERVERDRGYAASRSEATTYESSGRRVWLHNEAAGMNLSQASAQLSQAYESGKAAAADQRAGVPGAQHAGFLAAEQYDATLAAITTSSKATRGRGHSAEESLARAQYASVWTEFFESDPESEGRGQLLDWLTSRSVQNVEMLRGYHTDFRDALKKPCP